ncbi:hypothetical protein SAMN05216227_10182 [Pseudorhodobacter antarcticus]|uniref:Resolvase, N terminal domain n=1 Tax=Pseudorhodobacter antarcticus TaxID=1077947 RepID=A0A1H8HSB8_9RHOB|nr:resolvase [Pseudorhodobacter antarcticus]SEN59042.1 hypothetical protein SAMN05216227_10182 [Pseudorhodobacter antarcticus]
MSRYKDLKAVGYIRVSTEKQDVIDDALTVQAERIIECCKARGIQLLGHLDF